MELRDRLIEFTGSSKQADIILSMVDDGENVIEEEEMISRKVEDDSNTTAIVNSVVAIFTEEFTELVNRVKILEEELVVAKEKIDSIKTDIDTQVDEQVERTPIARLYKETVIRPTEDVDSDGKRTRKPLTSDEVESRRKNNYNRLAGSNRLFGGG